MRGLNRRTGRNIEGVAWIEQQIIDILTTPIVTRTMRADYGANLQQFVDRNITAQLRIELVAQATQALAVLKTLFKVRSIRATQGSHHGQMVLDIVGVSLIDGKTIQLAGVLIT